MFTAITVNIYGTLQ